MSTPAPAYAALLRQVTHEIARAHDLVFSWETPLSRRTAARIGGPAEALCLVDREPALIALAGACWAAGIPVTVLGGGANVLVGDGGVRGVVIMNVLDAATFYPPEADGAVCTAGSGHGLTVLARRCAGHGLAGFEWAASVPGTVGGAVVNNAGAHGGDMAANLVSARVLFPDGVRVLTQADMAYAYRASALKHREDRRFIVLSARLRFTPDSADAIRARIDANIAQRKRTQPAGASLGSIFRNPPGDYAGRLIEACGLKGCTIGGAQVSLVHANFFINTGGATADEYAALVSHVRAVVMEKTGVMLEPEIELIGSAGSR